ncbi:MAG: hypothetical protein NZL95_04685 [Chitinophagales bacterium]|nr:hypothetical protein [Chitinophagales bacterium]MDW8427829.1 hypothetical protein [Chitinophagales bacterium]
MRLILIALFPMTLYGQRYVYYFHGAIVEGKGSGVESPVWGRYEVDQIVERFKNEGFVVFSEIRPANTEVLSYAARIAEQIKQQLVNGTEAKHITLIGGSKGAVIAMHVAAYLKNPDLNVVLLGGCHDGTFSAYPSLKLYGNVLSIYEATDRVAQSCEPLRKRSGEGLSRYKEVKIHTGADHGFQFRPYEEWVQPALRWARGLYD